MRALTYKKVADRDRVPLMKCFEPFPKQRYSKICTILRFLKKGGSFLPKQFPVDLVKLD